MANDRLNQEQRQALNDYAAAHGRTWKQQLRDAWMTASEPGILHQLRNVSYFGPRGLNGYKVEPVCTCAPNCQQWLPCDCACHEEAL